jgi:dienelactone hydrolase
LYLIKESAAISAEMRSPSEQQQRLERLKRISSRPNSSAGQLGGITMICWMMLSILAVSFAFVIPLNQKKLHSNCLDIDLAAYSRGATPSTKRIHHQSSLTVLSSTDMDEDDGFYMDGDDDSLLMKDISEEDDDDILSEEVLQGLTIAQLKQQLRLRGLKVAGKKQDLVDRLLQPQRPRSSYESTENDSLVEPDVISNNPSKKPTKSDKSNSEFIDVTAYMDDDDKGKSVKSSIPVTKNGEENPPLSDPEVWGSDAKIVDDYEGRSPVVDGLSRTVIEFIGSNQTMVQAFVVASRDAMKPFLQGGRNRTAANGDLEARLREIQMKREMADKRPTKMEDEEGEDGGDEKGFYKEALNRDYSDWGKYSVTGAQMSAQEVQGVLILSDVYGPFTEATRHLAEKIAFECQPVVCMVPDLFRGSPWKEDSTTPGFNEQGQDYEDWRNTHSDIRVSVDIRAAAAVLREQYGVSSIVVWGTCYGGGRALEAAAGYLPDGMVHDVDGTIGPLPVDPDVVIAWYPTRYNAKELFGSKRSRMLFTKERDRQFAVMGVFAGNDKLSGATPEDATELKALLGDDGRVKDFMVKVFPGQDHGFAHNALGRNYDESELDRFVDDEFGGAGRVSINDGDAEVACLLSTAFMETYSRKFLPTSGDPISKDEDAGDWNTELNMRDFSDSKFRDVRQEIEDSLTNHKDIPLEGRMVDPQDHEEVLKALIEMQPENMPAELRIRDDDDLETAVTKLTQADENFQLF